MSATVVVSILQGAAAVLAFSRTSEFLSDGLKSYVREEDGAVILRMVGGLGVGIFCLEWVALALAFVLRYYVYVDRECGGNPMRRSAKVGGEDGAGTWPWPFQWNLDIDDLARLGCNFNETAPKHLNSTDLGALPRGNLTPTMPSSTITCGE
uniref:Uncharacterized protein n=1 Tax=Zea mays TaxID=4577 RepID=Q5GAU7_MAIZE|nr:unknown [Zea mays]